MGKLKVTITAPNTFSGIDEAMLNELASVFWCDPRELTVTVKVINDEDESNEQNTKETGVTR